MPKTTAQLVREDLIVVANLLEELCRESERSADAARKSLLRVRIETLGRIIGALEATRLFAAEEGKGSDA